VYKDMGTVVLPKKEKREKIESKVGERAKAIEERGMGERENHKREKNALAISNRS
jgi:hypothetical protein